MLCSYHKTNIEVKNLSAVPKRSGFSLLELVVALAVFSIGAIATGYLYIDSSVSSDQSFDRGEAGLLAKEGIEALISIRDRDFPTLASLNAGTTYYLVFENGLYWVLSSTTIETLGSGNKFIRSIRVSPYTGTVNPSKSYVVATSTVAWTNMRGVQNKESLSVILTNWRYERPEIITDP